MFIAMNRFKVKPGSEEAFEQVWQTRESYLDRTGLANAGRSHHPCPRRRSLFCCIARSLE